MVVSASLILCGGSGTFESYSGSSTKIGYHRCQLSQRWSSPRKTTRVGFGQNGSLNFFLSKRSETQYQYLSSTTGLLSFATIIIAGELNGFITWWSAAEGWPPWRWSGRVTTKFSSDGGREAFEASS